MATDAYLDLLAEILRLVRERKLAKQPGLSGHQNDHLRQEAYRWARAHGAIRVSTIAKIAMRLPSGAPLISAVDAFRGTGEIHPIVLAEATRRGWTKQHPLPVPNHHETITVFHLRPPTKKA